MTLDELNDYNLLAKRIIVKEKQIANLRQNMSVGSPNMDGLPHGSGISDRTGCLAIEIADLEARLDTEKAEADRKRQSIDAFINSIDDDITRLVYTWSEVADILGGYNTKESVRKRYFGLWEHETES